MQRFRERLVPGVGPMLAALLLLPAVYIIFLPISPGIGAVACVLLTLVVEAALVLSSPVVAVVDGVLHAGPARIPVAMTGESAAFRGEDATAARGTQLDARAFTLFRGWVDPVLRIRVTDPDDPVPYWLVSTRRPEQLQAAIADARVAHAS